jgi:hypothetical protein
VRGLVVQDDPLQGGRDIDYELAPEHLPLLSHVWIDAGYTGEGTGADWMQRVLG